MTPDRPWRADGIEPTYAIGDSQGWIIGNRIELETLDGIPVVAWAEFGDPFSPVERPLLATYHLSEYGYVSVIRVWRLHEPGRGGRRRAEFLGRDATRRYAATDEAPPRVTAAPALAALYEGALARDRAAAEADRRRREADPLIDVLDEIVDLAVGADESIVRDTLQTLVSTLPRRDVDELLIRIAIDYNTVVSRLYEREERDR